MSRQQLLLIESAGERIEATRRGDLVVITHTVGGSKAGRLAISVRQVPRLLLALEQVREVAP